MVKFRKSRRNWSSFIITRKPSGFEKDHFLLLTSGWKAYTICSVLFREGRRKAQVDLRFASFFWLKIHVRLEYEVRRRQKSCLSALRTSALLDFYGEISRLKFLKRKRSGPFSFPAFDRRNGLVLCPMRLVLCFLINWLWWISWWMSFGEYFPGSASVWKEFWFLCGHIPAHPKLILARFMPEADFNFFDLPDRFWSLRSSFTTSTI